MACSSLPDLAERDLNNVANTARILVQDVSDVFRVIERQGFSTLRATEESIKNALPMLREYAAWQCGFKPSFKTLTYYKAHSQTLSLSVNCNGRTPSSGAPWHVCQLSVISTWWSRDINRKVPSRIRHSRAQEPTMPCHTGVDRIVRPAHGTGNNSTTWCRTVV